MSFSSELERAHGTVQLSATQCTSRGRTQDREMETGRWWSIEQRKRIIVEVYATADALERMWIFLLSFYLFLLKKNADVNHRCIVVMLAGVYTFFFSPSSGMRIFLSISFLQVNEHKINIGVPVCMHRMHICLHLLGTHFNSQFIYSWIKTRPNRTEQEKSQMRKKTKRRATTKIVSVTRNFAFTPWCLYVFSHKQKTCCSSIQKKAEYTYKYI